MSELASMDVAGRLPRLRSALSGRGLGALIVSHLPNIKYLSGFTGSAGTLLVMPDVAVLVSDGRYRDQAATQVREAGAQVAVEIAATPAEQRAVLARCSAGVERLGLEEHVVTWAEQLALAAELECSEVVCGGALVEELRRSKDPGEVARIRAACAIADDALAAVLPELGAGPSERAFALMIEMEMRRRGAEGVSFDAIVASGPNSALPHARPTDRRIERGDLVVLDIGCVVGGYCSDMTRTVAVGDPGSEATRMFDAVMAANTAGSAAVRAGVACNVVDAAARAVIEVAGLADAFLHGTGHGVGIEIHEAPRLNKTARGTLVEGDVVTVEPGVYVTGVGGVRIEDTVVVTPAGAEPLTCSPKELVL